MYNMYNLKNLPIFKDKQFCIQINTMYNMYNLKNLPIFKDKQFCIQINTMYNIPGVLLTKLTNAVHI